MVLQAMLTMMHYLSPTLNDDCIDRLHYFWTSNILLGFSMLVSWKTFGGKPIECMFPKALPGSWEQYAENFCWSQDTYFLPPTTHVAEIETKQRSEFRLSYYQWVPFFLLLEAACFRLPSLIWKYLAGHSGIRIHEVVKIATDVNNISAENKDRNIQALSTHLQKALRFQRRVQRRNIQPHKVLTFLNLPYAAYFVTFIYLLTKVLYLINVIFQLYAMNSFLETNTYGWYGFGVVRDILRGQQWEQTGFFPRISICDFEVRQVANIQRYSVQCVLVINIFNEKIFVLLWFWYMTLLIATLCSFFYWFIIMILPWFGRGFISRSLELSEMPFDPKASHVDVDRFCSRYLRSDGVFVLRMIQMHAGVIFGIDLVLSLWRTFYGMEQLMLKDRPNGRHDDDKNDNRSNWLRLRRKSRKKQKIVDASDDDVDDYLTVKLLEGKGRRSSSTSDEDKQRKQECQQKTTGQSAGGCVDTAIGMMADTLEMRSNDHQNDADQ